MDDLDPEPYVGTRNESNSRNLSGRGCRSDSGQRNFSPVGDDWRNASTSRYHTARGSGWRTTSEHRNRNLSYVGHDWWKNRNDVQSRRGELVTQTFHNPGSKYPTQPANPRNYGDTLWHYNNIPRHNDFNDTSRDYDDSLRHYDGTPRHYYNIPRQPQRRRGGRTGFMNTNTSNNRAEAAMHQNHAWSIPREQHFNQRRGHPNNNNSNLDRNTDNNNQNSNQRSNFYNSTDNLRPRTNQCERILCNLGHVCPMKYTDDCGPCKRKVKKTLPCGHEMNIFCHLEPDDPSVKCLTMVDVELPDCGHKAQKMCYVDVNDIKCIVKCEYRVERCGHGCLRNCHVKDDPNHEKYRCVKECAKAKAGCTAELEGERGEHQCVRKCYETCDECNVQVTKRRSTCIHMERVTCVTNVDKIPCNKKCTKKMTCDHFCKKKCSEPCGDCKEMVTKEIPVCKHKITMLCTQRPTRNLCTNKCERTMRCGHKCNGVCGVECDPSLCTEPSRCTVASPCGHQVTLPCNVVAALRADKISEYLAGACTAPCRAKLACGHLCSGTCASCQQRRLHVPCTQTCHQINICGHQCEEPCNQICPPCKKQCEVRCQHSRCRQLCGAPCIPCVEKCGRRCAHRGACRRRCGETCTRAACDEPCARTLKCGHACCGLCTEPCPPVCRVCAPEDFPRDFLGDEFDHDARFILLQDCGHVMEVETMDNMMLGERETVELNKCPFCRKPIINTGRYKDLVNKIYKEEINPIKTRIYGTEQQIAEKKQELNEKIVEFRSKYSKVLIEDRNINEVYLSLQAVSKSMQTVASKLQLDMVSISLNILDMIAECYNKYLDDKLTELRTELAKQTEMLCQVFAFKVNEEVMLKVSNQTEILCQEFAIIGYDIVMRGGVVLKVSEQQQKDMGFEIKRMNSIVQLAKLTNHGTYASVNSVPQVRSKYAAARAAVFTWTVFDENRAISSLKELQEAVKVSGVVTKQERDMIVRAIGLKAGAWYKCPNGHFYCIGEKGVAFYESKCPECGLQIGGRNYTLAAGNAHAPEMFS